jgi:hypothetical protein
MKMALCFANTSAATNGCSSSDRPTLGGVRYVLTATDRKGGA